MASTDRELRSSTATYPSLVAFYNADPVRLISREQDVGLWWREGADGPLHRAAWVAETGEVYLVRLGPASEGGGAVEVLAKAEDPERLERMLSGWRQECGGPRSLQWLRRRTGRREGSHVRRPRPRVALGAGPMLT
jgi:hypothetical protein